MSFHSLFVVFPATLFRLGLVNVIRVYTYKIRKDLGLLRFRKTSSQPGGQVFGYATNAQTNLALSQTLFGWLDILFTTPPRWHSSPFDENIVMSKGLPWDVSMRSVPPGCDIKDFWELSRFYWVPELAHRIRQGDTSAGTILETWLSSWIESNPPYYGINWSCGQEASIRLLNLALAALILDKSLKAQPQLRWLVFIHLRRIAPTLQYAIGQANNHGSAEAAALFVGGSWLEKVEYSPEVAEYARRGRKWLVNRVKTLIQEDGSGNQYSTTYHRANLEVFCLTEIWRRKLNLDPFPASFTSRMIKGAHWLHQLTDPVHGDAPNFGPNDGSHLFSLTRSAYRDFRPTVHLTAALFSSADPYLSRDNPFEDRTETLGIPKPNSHWPPPSSHSYPEGGHHVLRRGNARVYFRYPRFLFRPGHADCLHVDLWLGSKALLRDGGSFSYADTTTDLGGVAAHNTVQFDQHDQMPRLGKFLYGSWPNALNVGGVSETQSYASASATHKTEAGRSHTRHVELYADRMLCIDRIDGRAHKATLRWRLSPGTWRMEGQALRSEECSIELSSSQPIEKIQLVDGMESLFYRKKEICPILEIKIPVPIEIRTEFFFQPYMQ